MNDRGEATKPRVGSSSCLLGNEVRYDGGHCREEVVADVLSGWLTIIPVCPEMEIGLGAPREPIDIHVGEGGRIALLSKETNRDFAVVMAEYARLRVSELEGERLGGFIFRSDSPSCGVKGVPRYRDGASPEEGSGLFAAELLSRMPTLPVVEEGDLRRSDDLYQFLVRVYTYDRWKMLTYTGLTGASLKRFHLSIRDLVEAGKTGSWVELGSLPEPGDLPDAAVKEYERRLMILLEKPPGREGNAETLCRIAFSLEKKGGAPFMAEAVTAVEAYRSAGTSLVRAKEAVRRMRSAVPDDLPAVDTFLTPFPADLAEAIDRPASYESR